MSTGAILRRTVLRGTALTGATLAGADLSDADLQDAALSGADLRGAQLSNVRNWSRIQSMSGARIGGVRNAPPGFVEFARRQGAIEGG